MQKKKAPVKRTMPKCPEGNNDFWDVYDKNYSPFNQEIQRKHPTVLKEIENLAVKFEDHGNYFRFTLNQKTASVYITTADYYYFTHVIYDYFFENFFYQLEDISSKRLEKVVMISIHHYKGLCKDCDNFESKVITDVITKFFISGGDDHSNMQQMIFTQKDKSNYTEIFVVEHDGVLNFLHDHAYLFDSDKW